MPRWKSIAVGASHHRRRFRIAMGYCISAAVWAGFFYWYLFHRQKNSFD